MSLIIKLNRLQRKVLLVILAIVVVPMLAAAVLASEWVATGFEQRLGRWIQDSSHSSQVWLQANQNDAIMLGGVLADDPEFAERLEANVADHPISTRSSTCCPKEDSSNSPASALRSAPAMPAVSRAPMLIQATFLAVSRDRAPGFGGHPERVFVFCPLIIS